MPFSHRRKNRPPRQQPYQLPEALTVHERIRRHGKSPVPRHISTIPGGVNGGGDSRNARKRYARREVYGVIDLQIHGTFCIPFGRCKVVGNNGESLDQYNIPGAIHSGRHS
ncbi:hypothetical protein LIER_31498 [Lithospermum erythrorhizon]|uniref:Uncharacterized protein n=1 Tax=Lithospermum erythrorhizon TaxID=34254 RepID=A0AAV3RTK1_LITER